MGLGLGGGQGPPLRHSGLQHTGAGNIDAKGALTPKNGGPPADLLINQGVRDNVSGHTTRAQPGRVRIDNQTVPALCHSH